MGEGSSSAALEILRSESLTSAVYKILEDMILDGEIAPGQRINENALANRLSVSRGPVQEALRGLAQEGLVKMIARRGMFVQMLSLEEALDAYEVRAALFGMAGLRMATSVTQEELGILQTLIDRMEDAKTAENRELYYQTNLEFHGTLLEYAGNEELRRIYLAQVKKLHLFRRKGLLPTAALKASNNEHRQILKALQEHNPEHARQAMEKHILSGKDRFLQEHRRKYRTSKTAQAST